MDIRINGKTADITLESEKTIGELLSGLDEWFAGSGFRLSGLEIDGESLDSDAIPAACDRALRGIRSVDIKAAGRPELMLEALYYAREYLKVFTEVSPEEGRRVADNWGVSAASRFLAAEFLALEREIGRVFAGEGGEIRRIYALIDEGIREITDPRGELARMEQQVAAIVLRLEDLPLDIQTGKDGRAAETVTLFSVIAEKLFRLLYQLQPQISCEEFSLALKELLAAYEAKDVVLIGDLAEYELAPRLQSLYSSVNIPEMVSVQE
ncbi:MAG: hypothetical protein LBQ38_01310 [Spirochaetaceae bacterium]|jgi:hypothetical protein|nr:hypothetical protein [Spirochaetaceae bacterium]